MVARIQPVAESEITRAAGLVFVHPGMIRVWFDTALDRSFSGQGVTVAPIRSRGWWAVTSRAGVTYYVSVAEQRCSCRGHAECGRCYHRARAIFEATLAAQSASDPHAA